MKLSEFASCGLNQGARSRNNQVDGDEMELLRQRLRRSRNYFYVVQLEDNKGRFHQEMIGQELTYFIYQLRGITANIQNL